MKLFLLLLLIVTHSFAQKDWLAPLNVELSASYKLHIETNTLGLESYAYDMNKTFEYRQNMLRLKAYGSYNILKYDFKYDRAFGRQDYIAEYELFTESTVEGFTMRELSFKYGSKKNYFSQHDEYSLTFMGMLEYSIHDYLLFEDAERVNFSFFSYALTTKNVFYRMAEKSANKGKNKNYWVYTAYKKGKFKYYGSAYYAFNFGYGEVQASVSGSEVLNYESVVLFGTDIGYRFSSSYSLENFDLAFEGEFNYKGNSFEDSILVNDVSLIKFFATINYKLF